MTLQHIFNQSVNGLRRQGQKSSAMRAGIQTCLYRGPDGLKCAVGHVIPDALYQEDMELRRARTLLQMSPTLQAYWNCSPFQVEDDLEIHKNPEFYTLSELLSALQLIHDQHEIHDWEHDWEQLAHRFNLMYTPPQETV